MTPGTNLAVALDFASLEDAERLAKELSTTAEVFKVGLELFTSAGPAAGQCIAKWGKLFLDLKLHDIPNTVQGAAREAARAGAAYLTVHALGGRAMVEAAVKGAGPHVSVLAVTVLTSLGAGDLEEIGLGTTPRENTIRLAKLAVAAGARGVVCSPEEVAPLRAALGAGPLLVVPGIRPAGSARGDQQRVGTPGETIAAGADLLVVGRPIREAASPLLAARAIAQEIATARAKLHA